MTGCTLGGCSGQCSACEFTTCVFVFGVTSALRLRNLWACGVAVSSRALPQFDWRVVSAIAGVRIIAIVVFLLIYTHTARIHSYDSDSPTAKQVHYVCVAGATVATDAARVSVSVTVPERATSVPATAPGLQTLHLKLRHKHQMNKWAALFSQASGLPAFSMPDSVKEGVLFIKAGSIFKQWSDRFCVLSADGELRVLKSNGDKRPESTLKPVRLAPNLEDPDSKKTLVFLLETPEGRQQALRATDTASLAEWLRAVADVERVGRKPRAVADQDVTPEVSRSETPVRDSPSPSHSMRVPTVLDGAVGGMQIPVDLSSSHGRVGRPGAPGRPQANSPGASPPAGSGLGPVKKFSLHRLNNSTVSDAGLGILPPVRNAKRSFGSEGGAVSEKPSSGTTTSDEDLDDTDEDERGGVRRYVPQAQAQEQAGVDAKTQAQADAQELESQGRGASDESEFWPEQETVPRQS